ncbi:MAG TPA: hypothetical protein VMX75_14970 [Spirochaetia bacterium]|nr:hypothetical protein [Spirochaetia bacterium]
MISFEDLKSILKKSIEWEKKLKDFYDVAEFALKSPESRKIIAALRDNLVERLGVLSAINLKKYGETEWVQFAPDYRDEDIVPIGQIRRDSTPGEIVSQILECETKFRHFYSSIYMNLTNRSQKDLFDSLVKFKEHQISEINNLLNSDLLST